MIKETSDNSAVALAAQANPGNTVRASWNFSTDDVRANTAAYGPEAQELLIKAFLWCIDERHPVAKPSFGRMVKASDNLIYKLYTGRYRDAEGKALKPSPELLANIREFLTLARERYEAGETVFVLTPTAEKVHGAAERARESNSIVFLWGPSHIGKSWALEHHAQQENHGRTIYCRLVAASGLGGMVRRIADRCGISDKSNTADLISRIKRALTSNMVLSIDECHLLAYTYRSSSFHNCMEVLREIHDETKCGLVLCFTILDDVKAASQKELQQLWRRGVHKVPLPLMPTKADLTAILEHNGMEFPEPKQSVDVPYLDKDHRQQKITEQPYEVLRQLAKREGLKAITERLRYGRKLASKSGRKLDWRYFLDAHLRIAKQAEQEGEWS